MDLDGLLKSCDGHVRDELKSMPDVDDVTDFDPVNDAPPIEARRWFRVDDVVVVVADLKSSTKLGLHKNARSTASIYEAALRPVVDIFLEFGVGWMPIHGDCVIGIFWGDMAIERALCAGITVKTFSNLHLVERLTTKWPERLPPTGFKIGMSTSTVLVKRVGRARTPHQDLVWPGKAVNYAAKAAQCGDVDELIVTGSVWDAVSDNDYVTFTCECNTPTPALWHEYDIDKLDHDDAERSGRCLTSQWCATCGDSFCNAILNGDKRRVSVDRYRADYQKSMFQDALAKQRATARQRQRDLRSLRAIR